MHFIATGKRSNVKIGSAIEKIVLNNSLNLFYSPGSCFGGSWQWSLGCHCCAEVCLFHCLYYHCHVVVVINKEGTLSSSFETRYVIEKSRNEKARLIVYFWTTLWNWYLQALSAFIRLHVGCVALSNIDVWHEWLADNAGSLDFRPLFLLLWMKWNLKKKKVFEFEFIALLAPCPQHLGTDK